MWTAIFGWRFDWPEFILGIVLGVAVAWLFTRAAPLGRGAFKWFGLQFQQVGENLTAGATDRYRTELVVRAETLHLARAIFALDEIAVPPHILAPAPPADPSRADPMPEGSLALLPNLPDWTYLAGVYRAPSLSLAEALSNGANVLITGEVGSGKSTALAYLAVRAANRDPEVGLAAGWVPVLVHAADLRLEQHRDPLDALIAAAQHVASSGMASRLPGYLRLHFRQQRGLVLLDGLDELAPEEIPPVAAWLESFLAAYPGNHIVAAGPARGYDGLARAGLAPVAIAPWTEHEQRQFLTRWGSAWQKSVLPSLPKNRMVDLDPALISGWLLGVVRGLTPLEMTLRVWAAYAGDSRGHRTSDNLDAYLARFLSPDERQIAEVTAMTWIKERQGGVPERALHRGTPVSDLVEAGVLVRRRDARLSFFQPGVGAYLAARGFASGGMPTEFTWEGWTSAESTLHWIAALGDVTALAERHLRDNNDPLSTGLLTCAGWLKDAPAKAPWRPYVLRAVASLIQDPNRPYGLRLRALHALAAAHEATVAILFRRLLTADEPSSRILAALGLGAARDEEAVPALLQAITQDRELFVRQAACLALAGIGTQPALEGLGQALLTGDEGVRLAAGEGLACHPDEGYAMLRDALEMDNLLTRRAAVFGLARVPEPWALEALEKVQVDDGQWVVRGAAAEAAGRRKNPPWKVVPPLHELAELPWLVAYAAREGLGVAPGRPALEMLRRVLASGTTEEKLAALDAIGWSGSEEFTLELDAALKSDDSHMRDAAFEARWRMAAPGTATPAAVPVTS
jgi:HEAT repeat protein